MISVGFQPCVCCCCGESTEAAANPATDETSPLLGPKRGVVETARPDGSDSGKTTGKDQYGSVDEKPMEKHESKDVSSASGSEKAEGLIGKLFKTKIVPAYKDIVTKIGVGTETAKTEGKVEKVKQAGDDENRKKSLTDIEQCVEKAIKSLEETVSTVCGDRPKDESGTADDGGDTKAREKSPVVGGSSPQQQLPQADDNGPATTGNKRKLDLKSVTAGLINNARKNSPTKVSALDEAHDKFSSLFEFVKPSAVNSGNKSTDGSQTAAAAEEEQRPRPERDEDGDDDQIEVVEEIVFVDETDGADGEEDEIIEEIIEETTTAGASPDEQPTVTVTKTTRKISLPSGPNGGAEDKAKKKHSFGLKLGASKSSANISAADKSPKKSVGSMSRLFKRSVSQPVESTDAPRTYAPNAAASATIPRKASRGSAGLLIFGKSRSKSTTSLEADDLPDVVTDVNVLSAFIDRERQDRQQPADAESGSPSPQENSDQVPETAATGGEKRRVGDLLLSATTKLGKKKSDGKKAAKKTKK